jgi:type II secretion system protein H
MNNPLRQTAASRGYTLVELLVVLALFGILMGIASLGAAPDPQQRLMRDAERLQTLFGLASEEAQLRARPIAWKADDHGYRFFVREVDGWKALDQDADFRSRAWEAGLVRLNLDLSAGGRSALGAPDAAFDLLAGNEVALEFPRNGLQAPFTLAIAGDAESHVKGVRLRGDGAGGYSVERAE